LAVPANQSPRPPASSLPSHLPTLDGVRAIAVLTVMVMHFTLMQPSGRLEEVLVRSISGGWAGVDLFFVLSGFLITGILVDAKGGANYFRNFYMRRSLRIFPLYYGYLALLFIALPIVVPRTAPDFSGFDRGFWLWTYLSNIQFARGGWEAMPPHTTHLWSLAIEEQFYLMWPFVVWMASRKALLRVCIGAIASATAARILLHFLAPDGVAGYALMPARIDALATGGLLAVLVRAPNGVARVARYARPVAAVAGAILLGSAVFNAYVRPEDTYFPALAFRTQLVVFPALAAFFGSMLVLAVSAVPGGRAFRMLTAKPMMAIGRYSYALYLLHVPLRDVVRDRLAGGSGLPLVAGSHIPAQLALLVVAIGISYVVAFLSWHCYEKHFLSLKRFFEYDRRGATAAQPAPAPAPRPAAAPPILVSRSSREVEPAAGD